MQNVIYIEVDTLAELSDLEMNANFICRVAEDGGIYRGDPEGGSPIKIFDSVTMPRTIRQIAAADELFFTDFILECTGTTYDVDLPEAAGMASGQIFYINNSASGTIDLVPFGTEGIQSVGNAPYSLTTGKSICICVNADSNGWLILSQGG